MDETGQKIIETLEPTQTNVVLRLGGELSEAVEIL